MDGNRDSISCFRKILSFAEITAEVRWLGRDCHIMLYGGERPHIGCTVLAMPRPSLRNDAEISSTASVLNVTGHKDEQICRWLAEAVCRKQQVTTVCTGGFHVDGITETEINEVMEAVKQIAEEI